jgi:hypothetical protein
MPKHVFKAFLEIASNSVLISCQNLLSKFLYTHIGSASTINKCNKKMFKLKNIPTQYNLKIQEFEASVLRKEEWKPSFLQEQKAMPDSKRSANSSLSLLQEASAALTGSGQHSLAVGSSVAVGSTHWQWAALTGSGQHSLAVGSSVAWAVQSKL